MEALIGTGVALVTPFDKQLKVDFPALERLLLHIADSQVGYLVVHGTTGEAATTTAEEQREILTFIQTHAARALPVVLGVNGNNTAAVLQTVAAIDWQGIAAVMVASPYYNRPSQEGIYEHYKAIADAAPVPVLLYNVPARTGSNIEAATTLRLSKHPNVVGIKEASSNLLQCMEIAKDKPDEFLLISGEDMLTLPILAMGGAGVISTVGNCFPKLMSELVMLGLQENFLAARSHAWSLWWACQFISQTGNPVGTKTLLNALGLAHPYVRLPLMPASADFIECAQNVVRQMAQA